MNGLNDRAAGLSASAPPEHRETNGLAIAALCCGLFPVTCLLGVAFGWIALHQLRTRLEQHGRWLAATGIVAGATWFTIVLSVPE